jgi:hypothetical protein
MLISILSNLVMEGGIIPPTPTPVPSDNEMFFNDGGISPELLKNRKAEYKKNIFEQDEEELLLFINNIIVSTNLN